MKVISRMTTDLVDALRALSAALRLSCRLRLSVSSWDSWRLSCLSDCSFRFSSILASERPWRVRNIQSRKDIWHIIKSKLWEFFPKCPHLFDYHDFCCCCCCWRCCCCLFGHVSWYFVLCHTVQGKNYTGAPGDFVPEMKKKKAPSKLKKEPLKIAIDCNVKACLMLQI